MTERTRSRRTAFLVTIALVAANLAALNVIGLSRFGRFDLTRERVYTLHPATRALLGDLDDLVTLTVYLSERRFRDNPRYATIPRQVRDTLEEFAAAAGDRLQIEFRDPTDDPDLERRAAEAGVQPVQVGGADEQSLALFSAYCGVVASYGGRPDEVIPIAARESLEFDLAMAIARLTRRDEVTIGFNALHVIPEGLPPEVAAQLAAQGRDRIDIDVNYRLIKRVLEERFEVVKVLLDHAVPDHVDALVVMNTDGMDDVNRFHLDQFVMKGKPVIFLVNGTEQNVRLNQLIPARTDNDAFMRHYGFEVDRNLVLDRQCQMDPAFQPYYFLPTLISRYFDQETSLLAGIDSITLWMASSIRLDPPPGVTGRVLARTSPRAWDQQGFYTLDRTQIRPPPTVAEERSFDMIGLLEGRFRSWFETHSIPDAVTGPGPTAGELGLDPATLEAADDTSGGDESGDAPDAPDESSDTDEEVDEPGGGIADGAVAPQGAQAPAGPATQQAAFVRMESQSPPDTSIVVVGNSRFLLDDALQSVPSNAQFFRSLLERLTSEQNLTDIGNRSSAAPTLREDISPAMQRVIRYAGMFGMPALVLVLGAASLVWRRARRGRGLVTEAA